MVQGPLLQVLPTTAQTVSQNQYWNHKEVGCVQNGRATPGTISSGPRRSARSQSGKPASGLGNKKRKHSASTSPSNSESQEAPSSNTSGGVLSLCSVCAACVLLTLHTRLGAALVAFGLLALLVGGAGGERRGRG